MRQSAVSRTMGLKKRRKLAGEKLKERVALQHDRQK
jgi:hypothetical protein